MNNELTKDWVRPEPNTKDSHGIFEHVFLGNDPNGYGAVITLGVNNIDLDDYYVRDYEPHPDSIIMPGRFKDIEYGCLTTGSDFREHGADEFIKQLTLPICQQLIEESDDVED